MASEQQNNQYTVWAQVITVLLLTVGAIWLPSLESTRPQPTGQGLHTNGIQNLDVRLWQDPYAAPSNEQASADNCYALHTDHTNLVLAKQDCSEKPYSLSDLNELINKKLRKNNITVIYGLISAGNSVGADEERRRDRYAVLTGLKDVKYLPEDTEHIGAVSDHLDNISINLRFEWFSAPDNKSEALLIWLDESALERDMFQQPKYMRPEPLARLFDIHQRISNGLKNKIKYIILGPSTSEFLRLAKDEYCTPTNHKAAIDTASLISWYSPLATIPDRDLACENTKILPLINFLHISRTISTDDVLTQKLADELKTRRVNFVYLVGQWDTAYARALADSFSRQWCKNKKKGSCNIKEATYLRGLDGRIPHQPASNSSTLQSTDSKTKSNNEPEHPEGPAQLDYLRRLGDEIRNNLDHSAHKRLAVGIFGNDYHDKLLVLQELRTILPQAVFFTTDLDAAMFHPKDNKYTRNLIVASSYPLYNDEIAGNIREYSPSFRTSYQTALYQTVRTAFHAKESKSLPDPEVYEIGRKRPVKMIFQAENSNQTMTSHGILADPKILYIIPLFVAMSWLMFILAGHKWRKTMYTWGAALLLSIIVVHLLVYSQGVETPEPLSFFQGVSIWPSEVIRVFTIALAFYLMWKGHNQIKKTSEVLVKRYRLRFDLESDIQSSSNNGEQKIEDILKRYMRVKRSSGWRIHSTKHGVSQDHKPSNNSLGENLKIAVIHALDWLTNGPWIWRSILFILLFFLLIIQISRNFDLEAPIAPLRGDFAYYSDFIVIRATVITFIFFLFYVLHRLSLAIELTRELQNKTIWPKDTFLFFDFEEAAYPSTTRIDSKNSLLYSDWLNAQLLATATEPVQRLVFYSLVIWILLIISRSHLIDGWHTPPFLFIIFGIYALLIIIPALTLRRQVEILRSESLRRLDYRLIDALSQNHTDLSHRIDSMKKQLQELKIGAFAHITHQPLFQAAIAIIGSVSGLQMLERYPF